ncbi:MAG: phage protein GemA/Gp16 family protein [Oscillospiraceae bacterium]
MEKTIESWQRGAIFSNAGKLGISRNSHEDELHILIEGLSGKTSIKELTFQEANIIIDELKKRAVSSLNAAPAKKKVHPTVPGGVTSQQQGKIWALIYELIKYDTKPVKATVGKRQRND